MRQSIDSKQIDRLFWQISLLFTILALCTLFTLLGVLPEGPSRFLTSRKWMAMGGLGILGLGLLITAFSFSWTNRWDGLEEKFSSLHGFLKRLGILNLVPVFLFSFVFILLVYMPIDGLFEARDLFVNYWTRLTLVWLLAAISAPFLAASFPRLSKTQALLGSLFIILVVHKVFSFLPDVSNYPFSLAWSEASRYYYASLFYSGQLYGFKIPWSFLHPSRYLLQSIPFLVSGLPLWFHRLWQVLLWLGLTGLTSVLFIRRLSLREKNLRWLGAAWAFFFIFQGPVYYHLLACVALVLWGFDRQKPWRSLAVVVIASAWAGISRVNWFPVPAFLAIMLYVLEREYRSARNFWGYWRQPILWAASGGASALAAQAAYMLLSGDQNLSSFSSSFTSNLLWYRLWPNATYHAGVVPMILLLSLPLVILLAVNLRSGHWHPLRMLALGGMTLVLFAGGLVVSTKIGGGGNLHNMDAYLILLMVWGGYLLAGKFNQDVPGLVIWRPAFMIVFLAVLPLFPLLSEGAPLTRLNHAGASKELARLTEEVQQTAREGGRVLFIYQRHLITFHLIDGVPLEPDYEVLDLMEMAMSNNTAYLQQFYDDLQNHKYDLIVTGKQFIKFQDVSYPFSAENNVWVERVSIPLLQYYQEKSTLSISSTQLLVPRMAAK